MYIQILKAIAKWQMLLHEYSGNKALAIASNDLPKPNPMSFEHILEQQKKVKQKQEAKEVAKSQLQLHASFRAL